MTRDMLFYRNSTSEYKFVINNACQRLISHAAIDRRFSYNSTVNTVA